MSLSAEKVLSHLKKIPKGRVTSYGILAGLFKTSPRAVGRIMKCNQSPEIYPCYKVVLSSGKVGNYSGRGGIGKKISLLEKDGIAVEKGRIGRKYFWTFGKNK